MAVFLTIKPEELAFLLRLVGNHVTGDFDKYPVMKLYEKLCDASDKEFGGHDSDPINVEVERNWAGHLTLHLKENPFTTSR